MMYLGIDEYAHQPTISLRDESGDVIPVRHGVVTCKRASVEIKSCVSGLVPSSEGRVHDSLPRHGPLHV